LQAANNLEQNKLQLEIQKKELNSLIEQKDNFLIDQVKSLS
jgi:outer membrane protein TolC